MIPSDVVTALQNGLLAVVEVAALAFSVLVAIAAVNYMRRAVGGGYTGPVVNEYATEASAYGATPDRSSDSYLSDRYRAYESEVADGNTDTYEECVAKNDPDSPTQEDRRFAELNARTDLDEWEKNQIYADWVNKK